MFQDDADLEKHEKTNKITEMQMLTGVFGVCNFGLALFSEVLQFYKFFILICSANMFVKMTGGVLF